MLGTLDKIDELRKVSLFQGLLFEDLETISRIARCHAFDPGSVIFRQDDPGDSLYVVIEGKADVVLETESGEKLVATVGPHGYFGEMAILDDQPRSATVRVTTSSTLLKIWKDDFRGLLRTHPDLALELLRLFSTRIRLLQETP